MSARFLKPVLPAALTVLALAAPVTAQDQVPYHGLLVSPTQLSDLQTAEPEPSWRSVYPLPAVRPTILTVGASSFQVRECDWGKAHLQYGYGTSPGSSFRVHEGESSVALAAQVRLPVGSQIVSVRTYYYDTDEMTEPSMGLWLVDAFGRPTLVQSATSTGPFKGGDRSADFPLWKPHVVENPAADYEFFVILSRADNVAEQALYRVEVSYFPPSKAPSFSSPAKR